MRFRPVLALLALQALHALPLASQDRLRSMPGYAQYAANAPRMASLIKSGAIAPQWAAD